MENNELDDLDVGQDTERLNTGEVGIVFGIISILFGGGMGIRAWINGRALRKEKEKNLLYQEVIRKHQAEIDALKNFKEREDYKNRLWEELNSQSEE